MPERRLSQLIAMLRTRGQLAGEPLAVEGATEDPVVAGVRYDARQVRPGDVFVARRGQHADGHDHAPSAVTAGAIAVIGERQLPGLGVPELVVSDSRTALGLAAAWQAGDPSLRLGVIGITGTDGKTTTAYLIRAVLEASGRATGLVGTTDVIVAGRSLGNAARATTPEAPELQGYLAAMLAGGDEWAVVESTSHGLAQQRVGSVAYDVAVLTNITSEHLEFHGSLAAYREAKHTLFTRLAVDADNPDKGWGKHAVLNADDEGSIEAAARAGAAGASVLRYGLAQGRAAEADAGPPDLVAEEVSESAAGLRFRVAAPGWSGDVTLRLAGRFNVHNALAALGVASALELDLEAAAAALAALPAVPGRMERVDLGQPFSVVIDYAHTADSLAKVLDELAPLDGRGGLIAVFGSAGERDTQKRAVMGRVAGERCRLVVVTDEDPRREDRQAILEHIARGAEEGGRRRGQDLLVIADRREAIAEAVRRAQPGDVVLLAGKGHERTIEMADGDRPWDERAAAEDALRSVGHG